MTNREKYKQAFSAVHASNELSLEVEKMKKINKQYKFKKMIASVAACVVILGSATTAYAADVGGIQQTIQLWIHGNQTEANIQFDESGNYSMDYVDESGSVRHQEGGAVFLDPAGSEIPASEEDILELLMAPDVVYEEDGSVWVYWMDQEIDITDKFEDDVCYVTLESDSETLYMTVKYQGGYSTSPDGYVSPSAFNE